MFLLAGYLAFGDIIAASRLSTPQTFVADIGRTIGDTVTGIGARVSALFGR